MQEKDVDDAMMEQYMMVEGTGETPTKKLKKKKQLKNWFHV